MNRSCSISLKIALIFATGLKGENCQIGPPWGGTTLTLKNLSWVFQSFPKFTIIVDAYSSDKLPIQVTNESVYMATRQTWMLSAAKLMADRGTQRAAQGNLIMSVD